ncbi:DUF6402 family protein [Sphingomonas sp. PB4P5]|uniref:DUF6402 family protein n=1 Tax=Parasphingomonas puruogangriensis TaxID=3096155 RepID=UPI002FC8F3E2
MPFTIRDIPAAMRKNGWAVGARLMDRWFAGTTRAMRARDKVNLGTWPDIERRAVTMRWALGFARVAEAQQRLLTTWHQPPRRAPSAAVTQERLRASGLARGKPFRFGNLGLASPAVDAHWQVNREVLESTLFGTVDDFYCAMGNALLMLAVAGEATPLAGGRWRVTIDDVGTYIRDSYDFLGSQRLGAWGPDGFSRIALLASEVPIIAEQPHSDGRGRYFSVSNESFDKYRNHYGRGGDFAIFSDIVRTRLAHPVTMELVL